MKESIEKIQDRLELSNAGLTLAVGAVSALAALVTAVFKGGAYLYYRGYYDAWNIPAEYIEMDYNDTLFRFLVVATMLVLLMGISTVYVYFWKAIREENKCKQLLFKQLGMIFLLVASGGGILFGCFITEFSPVEIVNYLCTGTFGMYIGIFLFIALFGFTVFSMGTMGCELIEGYGKRKKADVKIEEMEKTSEEQKKRKKVVIVCYLVCILVVVATIFAEAFIIYSNRKAFVEGYNRINVVSVDNAQYALVSRYGDKWILKEVYEENGDIVINKDHFMIEDITGCDVVVRELSKGTLKECLWKNDDFKAAVARRTAK